MKKDKEFIWVATSDDGSYYHKSEKRFATKAECYNDMRNAALEKMKWNTEYDTDLSDNADECIGYKVTFTKDCIIHESYSGKYIYEIGEAFEQEITRFIIDFDVVTPDAETMKEVEAQLKELTYRACVLNGWAVANTMSKKDIKCDVSLGNLQVQHIK